MMPKKNNPIYYPEKPSEKDCPECEGSGYDPFDGGQCDRCAGTGVVSCDD